MVKKQKHQHLGDPLFRREMSGVVPLKTAPTTDSKAPSRVNLNHEQESFSSSPHLSYPASADNRGRSDAEDGSSHRKNGIQRRTLQKLKRGRFKVGAELDLHSLTIAKAHSALLDFIAESQARSLESVRVIHGKGLRSENGPRLKLMARQLLRDHPQVLAYTRCKPADGGDGAVDILLKSS